MRFDRRKVVQFVLAFLPLFALFLWLYSKVLPVYERSVLAVANPILRTFEPPLTVDVQPDGDLFVYVVQPDGGREPWSTKTYSPYVIFLSIVLLPALLLATPVGLLERLRLLGCGVLLLYVVHVITMAMLFRVYLCLADSPEHFACRWLKGLLLTSGQITAVAGWGLLTWSYWLPGRRDEPAEVTPSRNARCPCGSGRKYKHCCSA